jgi:pimeloyl-ACP methyl ester carboxylesterase
MVTAAVAVGIAVVAAWSAVVGLLWWQQDRMIFPGWGFRTVEASGVERPDERLVLVTPDETQLVGALHRTKSISRGLILVFGGNAEDADWRLRDFRGWLDDVDIATFFYRGYGPSGGVPSEGALVADAVLIHDRLVDQLRPTRVVAAGFSLGSGVAAQLARQRRLAGLILVTAFDSIEAMAAARYPFAPVSRLLRHPFRSDVALAGLDLPVAVIAAEHDHVVPPRHTRRLVDELEQPVQVTWIKDADHVSIYDHVEYRVAFAAALDRVLAATPSDTAPAPSGL